MHPPAPQSPTGNAYYVGVAAALPPETVHTDSGAAFAITANRVAYALALRGPAVMVDTACSASLVAMHMVCACVPWLDWAD